MQKFIDKLRGFNHCYTNHIEGAKKILEVRGSVIYTRNQIAELAIQAAVKGEHIHIPESFVESILLLLKFYDKNFLDKLVFFNNILTHDVVALNSSSKKLEDYFNKSVDRLDENRLDLIS